MSTVKLIDDTEASAEALAIFNDIRAKRGTDFVNNFWRALAHDPEQLGAVWNKVKNVMAPGALDPLTKELVYIAVSTINACSYCVHSHTASARHKGMTDAQHAELLSVIALAAQTNSLANAMQVDVDERFKMK